MIAALRKLAGDGPPSLLFAVGDGNHSLATAKAVWEKMKPEVGMNHPARYALVEIENVARRLMANAIIRPALTSIEVEDFGNVPFDVLMNCVSVLADISGPQSTSFTLIMLGSSMPSCDEIPSVGIGRYHRGLAPTPRRKVRRGSDVFVTIMMTLSYCRAVRFVPAETPGLSSRRVPPISASSF